jgi:hypothetical protein
LVEAGAPRELATEVAEKDLRSNLFANWGREFEPKHIAWTCAAIFVVACEFWYPHELDRTAVVAIGVGIRLVSLAMAFGLLRFGYRAFREYKTVQELLWAIVAVPFVICGAVGLAGFALGYWGDFAGPPPWMPSEPVQPRFHLPAMSL